jgi:HK97 family phage portal protein
MGTGGTLGIFAKLQKRFWPTTGGSVYLWPSPTIDAQNITPHRADTLPPVARALQLVAGDIARLPIEVQALGADGYAEVSSPACDLLKYQPNEYHSGFEFRRMMVRDLMLWGNAAALIRRTRGGELLELVPLMPESFQIHYLDDGDVFYTHGKLGRLTPDELLHFRLPGANPLWGDSPVVRCRATLDLLAEQEQCGRAHFGAGATGKLSFETEEVLGPESVQRLQQAVRDTHSKAGSIATPIVTQGGMKVSTVGVTLSQNEWMTARNFSVQQVGQIFGIPPQMLYAQQPGDTAEHTYTQLRAYVDSCLAHYAALISGEIERKLLAPGERLHFDFRHMLRGSLDQVVAAARQAIDAGVMTQNEARALLGLPRIDGGDELIYSKNYAPGGETDEQAEEAETDAED